MTGNGQGQKRLRLPGHKIGVNDSVKPQDRGHDQCCGGLPHNDGRNTGRAAQEQQESFDPLPIVELPESTDDGEHCREPGT